MSKLRHPKRTRFLSRAEIQVFVERLIDETRKKVSAQVKAKYAADARHRG